MWKHFMRDSVSGAGSVLHGGSITEVAKALSTVFLHVFVQTLNMRNA